MMTEQNLYKKHKSVDIYFCPSCMSVFKNDESECIICKKEIDIHSNTTRHLKKGTILDGKYLIGNVIGEGGFGVTYIALDLNLNLKVAIKEYFPNAFSTRMVADNTRTDIHIITGKKDQYIQGLERYELEAHKLAEFSDLKGIVSVMNFFYENNTAYMVMEYIEGMTLKTYLKNNGGSLPYEKVLDMMEPVVKALALVHKEGIIHRDISPDNIMINKDNEVTVIDFGAARNVDENKSLTVMLKKGYAPPEQYQSKGNQGPWTDVYGICATMYKMITGIVLPDSLEILSKRAHVDKITTYKSVPKYVDEAILKGLETNIKERVRNLDDLYNGIYNKKKIRIIKRKWYLVGALCMSILLSCGVCVMIYDKVSNKSKKEIVVTNVDDNKLDTSNVTNDTSSNDDTKKKKSYRQTNVEDIKYQEDDDGICIEGCEASVNDLVIPSEINGKKVTSIKKIGTNVVNLIIPEGVTKIYGEAFRNNVYLETIYIPSTLSEIGSRAFFNCENIKDIIVSKDNKDFTFSGKTLYDSDKNEIISIK